MSAGALTVGDDCIDALEINATEWRAPRRLRDGAWSNAFGVATAASAVGRRARRPAPHDARLASLDVSDLALPHPAPFYRLVERQRTDTNASQSLSSAAASRSPHEDALPERVLPV